MKISNNDKLKMYQVHGMDNKAELRSLVFKISKDPCSPSVEKLDTPRQGKFQSDSKTIAESSSISTSEDNKELLSMNFESARPNCSKDVSTFLYKDDKSTNPVKDDVADSSLKEERTGQVLRRSLRLLALQSRIKVETCKETEKKDALESKVRKPKKPKNKKRVKKSPRSTDCTAASANDIKNVSMISCPDPKAMKLKTCKETEKKNALDSNDPQKSCLSFVSESHNIGTPKFSTVDPSRIFSTLFRQRNGIRPFERPMGTFLINSIPATNEEKYAELRSMHQYASKKVKHDLSHLCRKYRMLDLITLDNCYGMCHCSLKKTEVMLMDMLSGKEITFARNEANQNVERDLMNCDAAKFLPDFYQECGYNQNFENSICDSVKLSRKIIAQSMEILYNELIFR